MIRPIKVNLDFVNANANYNAKEPNQNDYKQSVFCLY
jgi:hypothetical protein